MNTINLRTNLSIEEIEANFDETNLFNMIIKALEEACDYEKGIKHPGIGTVVHEREVPECGADNKNK